MPNPIYTFLISSLVIIGCCNALSSWEVVLLILVGKVISLSQDDKWRDSLT